MEQTFGNCRPTATPPLASHVTTRAGQTPVSARSQVALDAAMLDIIRFVTTRPQGDSPSEGATS